MPRPAAGVLAADQDAPAFQACHRHPAGRGPGPKHAIGERSAVEVGQKRRLGAAQAGCHAAAAGNRAVTAHGREACRQHLPVLQHTHHEALGHRLRRTGQQSPSPAAPTDDDDPARGQPLHDLGQVMPRQAEFTAGRGSVAHIQ